MRPPPPSKKSPMSPFTSHMQDALREARAAAERGETPIGAVIVRDGRVIAAEGNRIRERHDPTAHAEILVLRAAGESLGSERLTDCDLYVTLEPCPMCAGAIALARIRRLYFGAEDPKGGGTVHGPRVFDQPTCHHRPEIVGGLMEADCATLLRTFFQARR